MEIIVLAASFGLAYVGLRFVEKSSRVGHSVDILFAWMGTTAAFVMLAYSQAHVDALTTVQRVFYEEERLVLRATGELAALQIPFSASMICMGVGIAAIASMSQRAQQKALLRLRRYAARAEKAKRGD